MKYWIHLAGRLYPNSWRRRYGEEFDALIEDAGAGWRDLWDVVAGGLSMQWTTRRTQIAFALAGLTLGLLAATIIDPGYEARIGLSAGTYGLQDLIEDSFTRQRLAEVIKRHDLYPGLRTREPMEDVIDRMRNDIAIRHGGTGAPELLFRYPDSSAAELAVADLAAILGFGNSSPTSIVAPQQAWIPAGCGLLSGLLLGAFWSARRRRIA